MEDNLKSILPSNEPTNKSVTKSEKCSFVPTTGPKKESIDQPNDELIEDKLNLRFFYSLANMNKMTVVKWFMRKGLIPNKRKCPKCDGAMKLVVYTKGFDRCKWSCRRTAQCSRLSIRTGTFFSRSSMPLPQILLLIYMWLNKTTCVVITHELGASSGTISTWKKCCREVCLKMCELETVTFGGIGIIVEIEITTVHYLNNAYLFAVLEKGSHKCIIKVVEDNVVDNLLEIIEMYVLAGSYVKSKCWKTFNCLLQESFIELQNNHQIIFIDSDVTIPMNNAERLLKEFLKQVPTPVTERKIFDLYLAEYVWRHRHNENFQTLVSSFYNAIATLNSLHVQL